jgi:cytochrome c oxidase cbb3-type subunit 3
MNRVIKFSTRFPLTAVTMSIGAAVALSACGPQGGGTTNSEVKKFPSEAQIASLPLGDIAGAAKLRSPDEIPNPLEGNATAIAEGHRLFISMNCAGCHGYDAKGGMGPNLTDKFWRYGGMPSSIYNSIDEGRPQGMPAWGRALPAQDIWKIVAFIETLGGAVAARQYHAGLQGDHDVTSVAPEAESLLGVFDRPSGSAAVIENDAGSAPAPASPQRGP